MFTVGWEGGVDKRDVKNLLLLDLIRKIENCFNQSGMCHMELTAMAQKFVWRCIQFDRTQHTFCSLNKAKHNRTQHTVSYFSCLSGRF
jgi:hypothetical protein